MGHLERRRLVVNADDFGRSRSINEAVIRAHREGILTTASLMVTGEAAEEAVRLARETPTLGVGLHLTLVHGSSVLPASNIPGLVDPGGQFSNQPAVAGLRYWLRRGLREELKAELSAQFGRFRETGLPLDHVNGHLHLHLHPVVFDILAANSRDWGVKAMRLTRDSMRLSIRCQSGRWGYRLSHAVIFAALSAWARPGFRRLGIWHTDRVVGLLADGVVDEGYLLKLLPRLRAGDVELYAHPSMTAFRHEYEALVSPRVRRLVEELGWKCVRYADLAGR